MTYSLDPTEIDCIRPAPTSVQEVPGWIVETRTTATRTTPASGWQALLTDLMSADDLEQFKDDLRETPERGVEYRARLHPQFGCATQMLP